MILHNLDEFERIYFVHFVYTQPPRPPRSWAAQNRKCVGCHFERERFFGVDQQVFMPEMRAVGYVLVQNCVGPSCSE